MQSCRLNKAIADAGFCSRRAADELIAQGRVLVNNKKAEHGVQVSQNDRISIDGKPIAKPKNDTPTWLILHKPTHVVSTASDPEGRTTVLDLIPAPYNTLRLYPVGRLDYFSEGLILLTNDGTLAHRLTHPKYEMPRTYIVRVRQEQASSRRELSIDETVEIMQKGMRLEDGTHLAPIEAKVLHYGDEEDSSIDLELILFQGINRQIRRMCEDLNLTILRLMRISHGNIQLGHLPSGKVRPLTEKEFTELKQSVGL